MILSRVDSIIFYNKTKIFTNIYIEGCLRPLWFVYKVPFNYPLRTFSFIESDNKVLFLKFYASHLTIIRFLSMWWIKMKTVCFEFLSNLKLILLNRMTWVANELVLDGRHHFFLECMRIPPDWHIWLYYLVRNKWRHSYFRSLHFFAFSFVDCCYNRQIIYIYQFSGPSIYDNTSLLGGD